MLILNRNYKKVCDIMKHQNCKNTIPQNQTKTKTKAISINHKKVLVFLSIIAIIFIGILAYILLNYNSETSIKDNQILLILWYITFLLILLMPIAFGFIGLFIICNNKLKIYNKIWIMLLIIIIFAIAYMIVLNFIMAGFGDMIKPFASMG